MKANMHMRRGGASLLTTVILAILLLGIVGGLTVLSVNELRQAANTEQSARALSAAESHVASLAEKISTESGSHERPFCNSEPGDSVAGPEIVIGDNSAITCATVSAADSEETVGVVDRDQSYKIDVSKAYKKSAPGVFLPVTSMSIEWNSGDGVGTPAGSDYPLLASGNWTYPATIESTYTWWNSSATDVTAIGSPSSEEYGIAMRKVVFKPGSNGPNSPNTICDTPETYSCTTLTNSGADYAADPKNRAFNLANVGAPTDAQNMVFKLTARYNGTHFKLRFYNNQDILTVPQPFAIIDVTARSNNLYRRVIAQKPLVASQQIDFLDNVVFSGKNICKDMKADELHGVPKNTDGTPVAGADNGKNTQACENPTP